MSDRLSDMLGEALRLTRELEDEIDTPSLRSRLVGLEALIEQARAIAPPLRTAAITPGTKRAALIAWLQQSGGATAEEIETAFGWSAGALSAVLSGLRRDGYRLTRYRRRGDRRSTYRIE